MSAKNVLGHAKDAREKIEDEDKIKAIKDDMHYKGAPEFRQVEALLLIAEQLMVIKRKLPE